MTIGPGKYDLECSMVRVATGAVAALVIVLGGTRGSGFSLQAMDSASADVLAKLPMMLRDVADQIEKDMRDGRP